MLSDTFLEKGLELFLCSHDFAFRDSLFPVRRQSDSYRDSFGNRSGCVRDSVYFDKRHVLPPENSRSACSERT